MPVPAALGAIKIGLGVAGVAGKLFGHKRRPDITRAIAELRASQPTGYLTPQDLRAAELTRGRMTEGIQNQRELAGYEIGRRSQARGMAGSATEERDRARLEQQALLGVQHAGESSEEQLYNMRTGREAFERQKALDIFGAQVGQQNRESERQQAENGAFWNSVNEFIPTILGGLGKGGDPGMGGGTPVAPQPGNTPIPPSRGFVPGPAY